MASEITLIGNEGFRLVVGGQTILIDPFYTVVPHVAGQAALTADDIERADAILVTHAHYDHFDPQAVADVARRTGCVVVGPAKVIDALEADLPARQLIELEPPLTPPPQPAAWKRVERPGLTVTALRTFHSRDHNSYLVEVELPATVGQSGRFRFFHDGDNEDTRRVNLELLSPPLTTGMLDLLLIAPWHGSGWAEFVERLSPRCWVCMHMTDEEIRRHAQGKFLPDLCNRVPLPDRLLVLQPGEPAMLKPQ